LKKLLASRKKIGELGDYGVVCFRNKLKICFPPKFKFLRVEFRDSGECVIVMVFDFLET
jgi:hypothetical protein